MAVAGFGGGCGWKDAKSFTLQVIAGRWFMAFATILIMSVSGVPYIFGLYSNDIKSSLGYDQTTLNLLSFFKGLGADAGILAGLIDGVAPPSVALSIGAATNFLGFFMTWLAVTGRTAKPRIWQMCLYMYIAGNSGPFLITAALIPCVRSFPESRGSVLGLLKGFIGLSSAIITQLYHAFCGENSKSLILFIAWVPTPFVIVFLRTFRIMKIVRRSEEPKFFRRLLYISLCLAGIIMVLIILQNKFSFTRPEYVGAASVVLILLFLPVAVVMKEEYEASKVKKDARSDPSPVEMVTEDQITSPRTTAETAERTAEKQTSSTENIFRPPARGEDYTILQALFSIDMVILFIATTCGIGGTLTAIDNLGQIGDSLGYPDRRTATFVSLVSIWNYLGRVVAGFSSEYLLEKHKIPRPLLFTLVLLLSCTGHLLIAFGVPNSLYFSSVIIGFCLGAQWSLINAIISELFGLKYFAFLYNFSSIASPLGSYILNVKVAGKLYDREALKQMGLARKAEESLRCNGVGCFRLAFLIITATTVLGSIVSMFLVLRTKKFYQGNIYSKFREPIEVEKRQTR